MAVIEFENVSKSYLLGAIRTSLREALAQKTRRFFSQHGRKVNPELFWALKDVSFRVEPGEVLGIIGPNGAGKSTILKILSRVTFPTGGRVHTNGRLAALIELGAGFHPDLSGRDNVYLNGAILGLKRREIEAQFSSIVEFAGLEQFIDTPVKRYSSGMYVRLAFAIAAHVKADLLLIDEVLSVGDEAFQQKCLAKMNDLRDGGATIVFVSHNLWSVSTFCERVLLLRNGQIEAEGKPGAVIQTYRRRERENALARLNFGAGDQGNDEVRPPTAELTGETAITELELLNRAGDSQYEFASRDHLVVRVHYVAVGRVDNPEVVIRIRRADGFVCCTLSSTSGRSPLESSLHGPGILEAQIGPLMLVPDVYTIEADLIDSLQALVYAESYRQVFNLKGNISDQEEGGVFKPDVVWSLRTAPK